MAVMAFCNAVPFFLLAIWLESSLFDFSCDTTTSSFSVPPALHLFALDCSATFSDPFVPVVAFRWAISAVFRWWTLLFPVGAIAFQVSNAFDGIVETVRKIKFTVIDPVLWDTIDFAYDQRVQFLLRRIRSSGKYHHRYWQFLVDGTDILFLQVDLPFQHIELGKILFGLTLLYCTSWISCSSRWISCLSFSCVLSCVGKANGDKSEQEKRQQDFFSHDKLN
jgi:hypothetical protein